MNRNIPITEEDNEILILRKLAQHDEETLYDLYKAYFPMVRQMVIQFNGNVEDAQDIFQEGMIVLLGKARSSSFTLACKLKTYLYSVCKHLWLKKMHGQDPLPLMEAAEEIIAVESDVEDHERKDQQYELMYKALSQLGEPCKTLLEEYYLKKKTMTEIATSFGYTNADNAKNQKYKCLMRLKKLFFTEYKNI